LASAEFWFIFLQAVQQLDRAKELDVVSNGIGVGIFGYPVHKTPERVELPSEEAVDGFLRPIFCQRSTYNPFQISKGKVDVGERPEHAGFVRTRRVIAHP